MNRVQPLTTYEVINLLKTIQPLVKLILENGSAYQLGETTQVFLSHFIEQINQADFSATALTHIYKSAGLSDQEMKTLWKWYSFRRAQLETNPPDGDLEMENWFQD